MGEKSNMWMPAKVPRTMGIKNPARPKKVLLRALPLKSFMSISSPDRNMMYNSPAVPERMMLLSRAKRFSPKGPMTIPETIIPNKCGSLSFSDMMGTINMTSRMTMNLRTGSVKGKDMSMIKLIGGYLCAQDTNSISNHPSENATDPQKMAIC